MDWLEPHTGRISQLVERGTAESLTLAALQCRLAIEAVCYERLRTSHDYISHADLAAWQPRKIVQQLILEVDPHAASTYTLSISKRSLQPEEEVSLAALQAEEYVEVGTQVGFDARSLDKLWQALGSFLHVRLPKSADDSLHLYGDSEALKTKVEEALGELLRLQNGTLVSSGWGRIVRFGCDCGFVNKRRVDLLQVGQVVSCLNPACLESWTVEIDGDDVAFHQRAVELGCHACRHVVNVANRQVLGFQRMQRMRMVCPNCAAENFFTWVLRHERKNPPEAEHEP